MWNTLPTVEVVARTAAALNANGIQATIVKTGSEAKQLALETIPRGVTVMTNSSVTIEQIELLTHLEHNSYYKSVRQQIASAGESHSERHEARRRHLAVDWAVGSVNAVTQDGQLVLASRTGSQLPFGAFSANHVLWIVGAQKIVAGLPEAWQRVYEYCLERVEERLARTLGHEARSYINRLLVVTREEQVGRIQVILVNEELGF